MIGLLDIHSTDDLRSVLASPFGPVCRIWLIPSPQRNPQPHTLSVHMLPTGLAETRLDLSRISPTLGEDAGGRMSARFHRAAAVALACGLLLTACTGSGDAEGQDSPAQPTDLAPFVSQEVQWADCPGNDEYLDAIPEQAQCASVTVPVDYFDGSSDRGTIEIALIGLPAAGESQGSLLVNPGGPGASGFDLVASSAETLQRNLPGYTIVGFDPRGVARSEGFDCKQGDEARLAYLEHLCPSMQFAAPSQVPREGCVPFSTQFGCP